MLGNNYSNNNRSYNNRNYNKRNNNNYRSRNNDSDNRFFFESKNLHYIFNVEYYRNLRFVKTVVQDNEEVRVFDKHDGRSEDVVFRSRNEAFVRMPIICLPCDIKSSHGFNLKTAYPGLVLGLGYDHGYGGKGEIGLGFSFDYVTGAPYIPGSTVKGVLRSAFAHRDYISQLLHGSVTEDKIGDIEDEIFEGKANGKEIPVLLRDTFYDAYSVHTGECIMAQESITPHKGETKNPTPLTLIKVKPDVEFSFKFSLYNGIITAEQKENLFKDILKDLGIGAKTNVGFGELKEV